MAIFWTSDPLIIRKRQPGMLAKHGRVVRVGQIWRANDTRRLRGMRVCAISPLKQRVYGKDIVSGREVLVPLRNFTTGRDGWSLEQEAYS